MTCWTSFNDLCGGHGGRVVTLSPPTSEVGGSIPVTALSGKAGSCLPLVGSLQYTTLANSMYWFPLPFQLPVVIWPVQCWKRRKTPNKQSMTFAWNSLDTCPARNYLWKSRGSTMANFRNATRTLNSRENGQAINDWNLIARKLKIQKKNSKREIIIVIKKVYKTKVHAYF